MKKKILVGAAILVVLAAVILTGVLVVSRYLVGGEKRARDKWEIETGTYTFTDDEINVQMYRQPVEASIEVAQILPGEYEQEGFTYYDEEVQQRLAQSLMTMMARGGYTMDAPLAVLNPFGTGSNGLYLYFTTDYNCQIRYTVTTDDESIPAYTATANSAEEFGKVQEFLLIGLVPGQENQVTLEAVNRQGEVKQSFTFTIQMPETTSGHPNRLEATEGESTAEMSDGLFYAMGLSDYYGYTFFFDNDGILRYEMLLDGYHSDRILSLDDQILACVGSNKIARISRIGQVLQVYDLGRFELHHDFNWGPDGELVALATNTEGETVEDQLIAIDMESGEVTLLVDFSALMNDYFVTTEKVSANSSFFWQAGLWDWLHLNSVQYLEEEDAVVVSSRETSTILKVKNVHEEPAIDWMIGDEAFWQGTGFAQYSLTREGDFTPPVRPARRDRDLRRKPARGPVLPAHVRQQLLGQQHPHRLYPQFAGYGGAGPHRGREHREPCVLLSGGRERRHLPAGLVLRCALFQRGVQRAAAGGRQLCGEQRRAPGLRRV